MSRKTGIAVLLIPFLTVLTALFFSVPSFAESSQTTAGIYFYDSSPVPHNQIDVPTSPKQPKIFPQQETRQGTYPKTGSERDNLLFVIIGLELIIILLLIIFRRRKEEDKHDPQT